MNTNRNTPVLPYRITDSKDNVVSEYSKWCFALAAYGMLEGEQKAYVQDHNGKVDREYYTIEVWCRKHGWTEPDHRGVCYECADLALDIFMATERRLEKEAVQA